MVQNGSPCATEDDPTTMACVYHLNITKVREHARPGSESFHDSLTEFPLTDGLLLSTLDIRQAPPDDTILVAFIQLSEALVPEPATPPTVFFRESLAQCQGPMSRNVMGMQLPVHTAF